jgi:hypothetical protein
MASRSTKQEVRRAADDAIEVLKDDPARFRALLRAAADLAKEGAALLEDAGHERLADKARLLSKSLSGAAILPAYLSAALAKKLLEKALGGGRG